jgi:NADH-quinone oxidoreductase subunit D
MESIYHFKIVMVKFLFQCAEIYPSCWRWKRRIRFYLVTDGSRTPYRLHFRTDLVLFTTKSILKWLKEHYYLMLLLFYRLNVIAGELDAYKIIEIYWKHLN